MIKIPSKGWIFHSTSKSTYLEVLKWIGGEKLSTVGLEISHLPVFTKSPYPKFSRYMKPIGDGWYVNMIGCTSNKFIQLKTINDKLNLGMTIKVVPEDTFTHSAEAVEAIKAIDVACDLGAKRKRSIGETLIVKYNGKTFNFRYRTGQNEFVNVIEAVGAKRISKLNLKCGSTDLLSSVRIKENMLACENYWLAIPNGTKNKQKILLTIKALLKLDMEIIMTNEF